MSSDHETRLEFALEVLDGLSVGDALGEALSYQHYRVRELLDFSQYHDGTLRYTDDTEMAIGIVEVLKQVRSIDEDLLAATFARRFSQDPDRGYGRMARHLLREISAGADWREVSRSAFGGGSFGNGAAMRVAPLGAYYSDAPDQISDMARRSAMITHYHPEGIAGAIAVASASATALASRRANQIDDECRELIWKRVLCDTPDSQVLRQLESVHGRTESSSQEIAREFGCGFEISAQDTVPFCIWNACRCIGDFPEALVSTIEVGGDCDTTAAIVGGIVCARTGRVGIPPEWLRVREALGLQIG